MTKKIYEKKIKELESIFETRIKKNECFNVAELFRKYEETKYFLTNEENVNAFKVLESLKKFNGKSLDTVLKSVSTDEKDVLKNVLDLLEVAEVRGNLILYYPDYETEFKNVGLSVLLNIWGKFNKKWFDNPDEIPDINDIIYAHHKQYNFLTDEYFDKQSGKWRKNTKVFVNGKWENENKNQGGKK